MKVKKIKRMTCTVMAATLSISPFLPLTEAYANQLVEVETISEQLDVVAESSSSTVEPERINEIDVVELEALATEENTQEFKLSDWAYEENARFIILTAARNDKMSIYIPGEYNGKQVILQDLKIFPQTMTELTIEEVNEKKVGLQTFDISKSFASSKVTSLNLSGLDTSKVTNMSELFKSTSELKALNLNDWDTSNVTNMKGMFNGAKKLTSIDLRSFDTSNVTTMASMFSGMSELQSLDLSSFDTSSVTDMSDLFSRCKVLSHLVLTTSFDTSEVKTMEGMFEGLESMTSLDLKHFNTSNVTDMSSMFSGMKALTSLNIRSFDTSNVIDMSGMFQQTESLETLQLTNFNTSKVQDMSGMFAKMSSLEILDTTSFDTSKVTNMSKMFSESNLSNLDLSHFNTISVKNMSSMFSNSENLASLDLTYFDTSNVENMSSMFSGMKSLKELDLSSFNFQKVKNMKAMFSLSSSESWSLVIFTSESVIHSYDFEEDNRRACVLSYSMPTTSSDVISGVGSYGTEIKLSKGGELIAQTTIGISGSYELKIPKQGFGATLTMEVTTPYYDIVNKKLVVRDEFKQFTLKTVPLPTTTAIYGTGDPGAKVEVYLSNGTHLDRTTVNSNGNFKLNIPKQPVHTVLTFKQSKYNYKPIVYKVAVYDELTVFETPTITEKSTALYGKGVPGAKVGIYTENGTRLAITTVNSKGNYKLVIPTQKVGTVLTIKQAKTGYGTLSKTITVLGEFKTFEINDASVSSTAIYGKGEPGAKVAAYVNGRQIGSTTTVNSKGNYKIVIPKQRLGVKVQVKMAKNGYATTAKNTTILNDLKTFTYSTPSTATTTITGKGVAGSKVGVYTSSGKRLAITTVSSRGVYTLTIPKQKAGTVLTIKQAKSGYLTLSKEVKVLNALKTFTHSAVKASSKTITGKGVAGAKVGVYDKNGKRLAITTVNSKGNYKLTIPKQKTGTKLVLKQAKSGYLTLSKNITVVRG